jgi:hypothetical protein
MDLKRTQPSKYYIQISNETDQRTGLLICIREAPSLKFDLSTCSPNMFQYYQPNSWDSTFRLAVKRLSKLGFFRSHLSIGCLEMKQRWTLIALCIVLLKVCSSSIPKRKIETKQETVRSLSLMFVLCIIRRSRNNQQYGLISLTEPRHSGTQAM